MKQTTEAFEKVSTETALIMAKLVIYVSGALGGGLLGYVAGRQLAQINVLVTSALFAAVVVSLALAEYVVQKLK